MNQTGYKDAADSVDNLHLYGHSQGGLLTWVAIKGQDFSNVEMVTVQVSGAPMDAVDFHDATRAAGVLRENSIYQVNRPDEKTRFGLPKTDSVADLPGLGGNARYSDNPVALFLGAIFSLTSLFDPDTTAHGNYGCAVCDPEELNHRNLKVIEMVINPTLIDRDGNTRRLLE